MDKIENGLHLGKSLKKSARPFLSLWQIAWNPWVKVVFAQNHLACDVTIILSVKEFHITVFEYYTRE